jgi:hypothetical protein
MTAAVRCSNRSTSCSCYRTKETMAATTAVAAAQGNSRRGPMFTPTEDLLICKSFVRASEDGTVGTDQKSSDFKIKMFEVYVRLLTEHNREFGSNYPFRHSRGFLVLS